MKKIIFRAKDITAEIIDAPPKKATAFIPEWYKNMSPFRNGQKKFYWPNDDATPSTIKKCVPFLDAMMAGYVVYTTEEILYQGMQIPPEYISEIAFKWQNFWTAKTPKGYSLFFTHPVNRLDLPFLTLSGFVDSDSYERVVNFPFFLKKDFQGIIPIGTPIAQFFPVKREKWVSQVKKFDEKKNIKTFQNTFIDYYKKNFWVRKDYS